MGFGKYVYFLIDLKLALVESVTIGVKCYTFYDIHDFCNMLKHIGCKMNKCLVFKSYLCYVTVQCDCGCYIQCHTVSQ